MRDNPVHVAAYGADPERRQRLIQAAFRLRLRELRPPEPFGLRSDGKLVAVTGIAPPGTCRPTIGQRLRMAPTMVKFGPRAAARTGRWLSEWARHDPDEPHSHLGPLAVDRDLQGRGIGSVLLKEYCRRTAFSGGEVLHIECEVPTQADLREIVSKPLWARSVHRGFDPSPPLPLGKVRPPRVLDGLRFETSATPRRDAPRRGPLTAGHLAG